MTGRKCIKIEHFLYRKRTQFPGKATQQIAYQPIANWHVFARKGPRDSNL